jgi:hypothetical protein
VTGIEAFSPQRPERTAKNETFYWAAFHGITNDMDELQKIYDSEINVSISWLWAGGIDMRRYCEWLSCCAELHSMSEVVPWLQEAITHFYPDAAYPNSLDAEIRAGAVRRVFCPPRIGKQVVCSHFISPTLTSC